MKKHRLILWFVIVTMMCTSCAKQKSYSFVVTENFWKAYRLDIYDDSRLDVYVKEITKDGDVVEIQKITNLTQDSIGKRITHDVTPRTEKIKLELNINLNPNFRGGRYYAKKYNGIWKSDKTFFWDNETTTIDLMSADFYTYSASIEIN